MPQKSRNIKLVIAYDGTDFSGWQRQSNDTTIQGEIERCLNRITQEPISLHGAGRTDAGVHAEAMVANFETLAPVSCEVFFRGLNSMLCSAIRIMSVDECASDFHSRFSTKGKHYQYSLFTGKIQPPSQRLYTLHVPYSIQLNTIESCLSLLEGTHDFSSFENTGSRDKNITTGRGAVRTIHQASCSQNSAESLDFHFIGDGFLRHMVRSMVGTLLEAGRGRISVEDFRQILAAKNRTMAGPTAAAHGLTLKRVMY